MAEDMEEVGVTSSVPELPARKYPGMSPLQAGLLYGGGAVATMGPLGLLIGLGSGLTAKRMQNSWMDQEARYRKNMREEHIGLMQELDGERRVADPDEARLIDHIKRVASDGWQRLANGDESGRDMIAKANELSRSIMVADSQARKEQEKENMTFQRGLITTAANDYRTQYLQNMKTFEDIDQKTSEVLNLVNSKDFDPNAKFNKAVVMDLISVGVNGLYRDDPSGLESLVRSVPVIGDGLGDLIKQEDYKLTREDYNRIAIEMKRSNERYSQQRMQRLGEQASSLDAGARRIGAIAPDYSLRDYISGAKRELQLTPVPTLRTGGVTNDKEVDPKTGRPFTYQDPVSKGLRRIEQWANKRQPRSRPTN